MRKWVVGVAVFLVLSQSAWATRTPLHDAAESPRYGRKFGGMIGRGALNVVTCFVDLLVNVVTETRNGPPLVGTLVGLGKGTGCATLRVLSGVTDLVTFWVPGFNGFPVSDSYENCLEFAAVQPMSLSPAGYPADSGWVEPTPTPGAIPASQKDEKRPRYSK